MSAACLLALSLASMGVASTGQTRVSGVSPRTIQESPRYMSLELKFGSYFPLIDREVGLVGRPYAKTFGEDASMLRFELELDKFVYQGYGSVAVGLGAGYAEKFAAASNKTGGTSTEKTGLRFYPLRLLALYRFDYAALHWNVPLVPYAKAALVYVPWQAVTGSNVDSSGGFTGSGGRWGYGFTAGLSLMLDFIEPRWTRNIDAETGINHTYFFAEYTHENVNGLGRPGLNLSSRRFMFGLALDI